MKDLLIARFERFTVTLRFAWTRWRRYQDDAVAYAALDPASLRDLAVSPSELGSYSVEAAGAAAITRRRVARVTFTRWRATPTALPEC